jgi:hypothetical protein
MFDTEDYKVILSWTLKNYDNAKKRRIKPKSDKANGIDLSFYGVKYNTTDSYDYENITKIDFDKLPEFDLLALKNLITVRYYNDPVEGIDGYWTLDNIPKTVKKLFFYSRCRFNKPINFSDLKLTHLTFGEEFNQLVDNQPVESLPDSITHLTFGYNFNQLADNLPNSITHLIFGEKFNQPVNKLPNSITHLKFIKEFDQPVDKLPNSITHLIFGENFNQPVDNLPESIIDLFFGRSFNQPIDSLPNSIVYLSFGTYDCWGSFNQVINKLPESLEYLNFCHGYKSKINLCNLHHLTKLVIPKEIKKYVPESLRRITKLI